MRVHMLAAAAEARNHMTFSALLHSAEQTFSARIQPQRLLVSGFGFARLASHAMSGWWCPVRGTPRGPARQSVAGPAGRGRAACASWGAGLSGRRAHARVP